MFGQLPGLRKPSFINKQYGIETHDFFVYRAILPQWIGTLVDAKELEVWTLYSVIWEHPLITDKVYIYRLETPSFAVMALNIRWRVVNFYECIEEANLKVKELRRRFKAQSCILEGIHAMRNDGCIQIHPRHRLSNTPHSIVV